MDNKEILKELSKYEANSDNLIKLLIYLFHGLNSAKSIANDFLKHNHKSMLTQDKYVSGKYAKELIEMGLISEMSKQDLIEELEGKLKHKNKSKRKKVRLDRRTVGNGYSPRFEKIVELIIETSKKYDGVFSKIPDKEQFTKQLILIYLCLEFYNVQITIKEDGEIKELNDPINHLYIFKRFDFTTFIFYLDILLKVFSYGEKKDGGKVLSSKSFYSVGGIFNEDEIIENDGFDDFEYLKRTHFKEQYMIKEIRVYKK